MEDEVGRDGEAKMLRITVERGDVRRYYLSSTPLVGKWLWLKVSDSFLYLEEESSVGPSSRLTNTVIKEAWTVVGVEEVPASEADLLRFQREGTTVPMVVAD